MKLKIILERYLAVNMLGPDPRLIKKIIYRAAVSQRLRNTGIQEAGVIIVCEVLLLYLKRFGEKKNGEKTFFEMNNNRNTSFI